MDKRYFLIIIIICVCCINLYLISNVSDVVGSASVDVGNYTFSLPEGFTFYGDHSNGVSISNNDIRMLIGLYVPLENKDTFVNKFNDINTSDRYDIISNGTINSGGIVIDSLYYRDVNDLTNYSTFYFTKFNQNFRILLIGFNYDLDKNKTIDIVTAIVNSIRDNYKVHGSSTNSFSFSLPSINYEFK